MRGGILNDMLLLHFYTYMSTLEINQSFNKNAIRLRANLNVKGDFLKWI